MAGRHQNRISLPAVQSSAQVHAFGNCIDSDMLDEDAEVYELRSRGKEKVRRSTSRDRLDDIIVLTKDIQEGDTLNAIALQYCCTVADIKRVNNLISDQDFFALRSIKIPVKKFSSLTETLYTPKGRPASRPYVQYAPEPQEILPADSLSSSDSAGSFLKEVDRDIEQIVKCTDTKKENLNEVVSALTAQQVRFERDNKTTQRKDPYYGADWGIGWWTAVVIMLIVGIITPVFYLLYYEILAKVDVSHHSTVDSSSHLHSAVTPPSQDREMENVIVPTKRVHIDQQDDHKLYSQDSQLPVAQHKT
ncbi:PREDICTED: lysM and putative peptidoglycan-binding domain-containing protein 3 [Dipodomys ordii]|uniref:LysM and putative peptidoglycan-binding domain-containing protein 3 n=1 Tax=Dipodomys ordii TaxID=10020 RepID=A0A1S3F5J1_DIPOR|nr:PREDICTED: lysM and putative peptidoglycan-binding domain-containing protein 3 [Dipodomys ordii]